MTKKNRRVSYIAVVITLGAALAACMVGPVLMACSSSDSESSSGGSSSGGSGGVCKVGDVTCTDATNCLCGTSCLEITTGNKKCTKTCSTDSDCSSLALQNGTPLRCDPFTFGDFCK